MQLRGLMLPFVAEQFLAYLSLPSGGGGGGRCSLGVRPRAPSSSRTHVISVCVRFRTAWSGQPRVAAISSLVSPATRWRRTSCSSCVSCIACSAPARRIEYDPWTWLVAYRRCCQPNDGYPILVIALRLGWSPVVRFRITWAWGPNDPRPVSRSLPTNTALSVRSSSQSIWRRVTLSRARRRRTRAPTRASVGCCRVAR
jgi:hypothetical protein